MEERYIPKHPTRGWLFSECDRIGASQRGKDVTDEKMCALLRSHGYDVSSSAVKKHKHIQEQEESRLS